MLKRTITTIIYKLYNFRNIILFSLILFYVKLVFAIQTHLIFKKWRANKSLILLDLPRNHLYV